MAAKQRSAGRASNGVRPARNRDASHRGSGPTRPRGVRRSPEGEGSHVALVPFYGALVALAELGYINQGGWWLAAGAILLGACAWLLLIWADPGERT